LPVLLYGHFIHYSCSGHSKMSSAPTDQFPMDTTTLSLILKHLPLSTRSSLNRAARCARFTHTGYVSIARHHYCTPHVQFLARIASHIKFAKCFPLYTKGTKNNAFSSICTLKIQYKLLWHFGCSARSRNTLVVRLPICKVPTRLTSAPICTR
jgi:hypothetical protein